MKNKKDFLIESIASPKNSFSDSEGVFIKGFYNSEMNYEIFLNHIMFKFEDYERLVKIGDTIMVRIDDINNTQRNLIIKGVFKEFGNFTDGDYIILKMVDENVVLLSVSDIKGIKTV